MLQDIVLSVKLEDSHHIYMHKGKDNISALCFTAQI